MAKRYFLAAGLLLAVSLAGCQQQTSSYVDMESMAATLDQMAGGTQALEEGTGGTAAETQEGESTKESESPEVELIEGYDESANFWGLMEVTWNNRYIYTKNQRVDLKRQTYGAFCDVVGCVHKGGDCELSVSRTGMKCCDGGVYYTNGDTIYYRNVTGGIEKVFTNTYSNEYTRKNYPETDDPWDMTCPEGLSGLVFLDEHTLLVSGVNFFFRYDLLTGKASKPVDVCESYFMSFCCLDGIVYSSTGDMELYRTDLEAGVSERVLEQGINVRAGNGRLWYVRWVDGVANIYSNNAEFTDEVLEVKQASPMFQVFDERILYWDSDYTGLMLHTVDGEEKTVVEESSLRHEHGKEGYRYSDPSIGTYVYMDGTLYFSALFQGSGPTLYDSESVEVWYSLKDGVLTEFTEV